MPNHDFIIDPLFYENLAIQEMGVPIHSSASGSASVTLTDTSYGSTSVELLGPDALALVQYDGTEEAVVVLSKDMIFELLGVLKSAVA